MRENVIGQEAVKVKLAHCFSHYTGFLDDPDVGKPLPIIYGPSGAGKTYAIELCCEISGLDLTTIGGGGVSAAGYKGTTLRDLVTQHFVRYQKSEGVIFIDEVDKWCRGYIAQYEKTDPESVALGLNRQAEALRYVENETIDFIDEAKDYEDLKGESFTTGETFWIFAGAFVGVDAVARRRMGHEQVGSDDIWEDCEPPDFIHYGMIEEFVNRVSVWGWVKPLTSTQILQILELQDKPKWIKLFEMIGCSLDLQSSALATCANLAYTNKRGPRGAKMYMNRVLGDIYTECGERELTSVVVDGQVMTAGRFLVGV